MSIYKDLLFFRGYVLDPKLLADPIPPPRAPEPAPAANASATLTRRRREWRGGHDTRRCA